ncbi:HD domain-containing protein [Candidatus Woesearchaeota archaeon]|nr:HD domain-containing protein [Candidatus Woesearchaeota archaeon]
MSELTNFLFEAGHLKRQIRHGWSHLGHKSPESIADHSWRTAVIAYTLAALEGLDAEKAASIALFHELGEARIGDLDKVQQRYFPNKNEAEARAFKEQMEQLPEVLAKKISGLMEGYEESPTPEQDIVRDADFLECMLQAKEYLVQGYEGATNWLENCPKCLKTTRAKELAKEIIKGDPNEWYKALKAIKR